MTEIQLKALTSHLKEASANSYSSIYLLYGDEFLFKKGFQNILDALLPEASQKLNYISLNGSTDSIMAALKEMNTFSLLSEKKVVAFHDARLFDGAKKEEKLIEKAKEAFTAEKIKKAAGFLLKWLAAKGAAEDQLKGAFMKKPPFDTLTDKNGLDWVGDLIAYIHDEDLKIPKVEDEASLLSQSLDKGFPSGHHLIITSESVQKRHRVYKAINEKGTVINCAVAKGQTRADRTAQKAMLQELFRKKLSAASKKAQPGTFDAIVELTGFDLRIFVQNIEKLINYAGSNSIVTVDDVRIVLTRSKKDPIFEFTNAITERDLERSLFYLSSLLEQNFVPLQILSAMVNQFRRLIMIKEHILQKKGSGWQAGMGFDVFKSAVMPNIKSSDQFFSEKITEWHGIFSKKGRGEEKPKKKSRKKSVSSDLMVSKSITNPYPMYLMFKKSEKFKKKELLSIYVQLMKADIALKSQGNSHKLILERVIFFSCQKLSASFYK